MREPIVHCRVALCKLVRFFAGRGGFDSNAQPLKLGLLFEQVAVCRKCRIHQRFVGAEVGDLGKRSDRQPFGNDYAAGRFIRRRRVGRVFADNKLEKRSFARSVYADNAEPLAFVE